MISERVLKSKKRKFCFPTTVYSLYREWYEINYKQKEFFCLTYNDCGMCVESIERERYFEAESLRSNKCNYENRLKNQLEFAKYVIAEMHTIKYVQDVVYVDILSIDNVLICNKDNCMVHEEREDRRIKLTVYLNINNEYRILYYFLANNDVGKVQQIKKELDEITQLPLIQSPREKLDLLFMNGSFGFVAHEVMGHLSEVDFYLKYRYLELNNDKFRINKELNVIDGFGGAQKGIRNLYDDEGYPVIKKELIKNGEIKEKLSTQNYSEYGIGNGRRESYRKEILPRMHNTIVLKGGSTDEDILKNFIDGVVLNDVVGGVVNFCSGEVVLNSFNAKLIKNGKCEGFINRINIITDAVQVLNNIQYIGNRIDYSKVICKKEGQQVSVCLGAPMVTVHQMNVG